MKCILSIIVIGGRNMSKNTHAVGQLQGYLLQTRHMFYELISLDDITVSMELLDDVAIESKGGTIIAEQLKSVTSDNNPLTDRSVVFWKTLYNWLEYVRDGSLTLDKTTFRMIIVSNSCIKAGGIIQQLSNAGNSHQANEALQNAIDTLWGSDHHLKSEIPPSYAKYLEVLFDINNKQIVITIIEKMSIDIHENNYDDILQERFSGIPALIPEFTDKLFVFMIGWVNERVNEFCKSGKAPFICNKEFNEALQSQMRLYNQWDAIPFLSEAIEENVIRTEVEQQDIYIQQLEFIENNFSDKLEAASDFLRTKTEKTMRAEKGILTDHGFADYSDKIKRAWNSKQKSINLNNITPDVEKGKMIYYETKNVVIDYRLQGGDVPSFFGSGVLHSLANTPKNEPCIGWHPNYKSLLKEGGEKLD